MLVLIFIILYHCHISQYIEYISHYFIDKILFEVNHFLGFKFPKVEIRFSRFLMSNKQRLKFK